MADPPPPGLLILPDQLLLEAAPSPPGLLTLPDELLLDILNHIDEFADPWRTRCLYALSMSGRRLHGFSQPYLYSTFSFHAGVPAKFMRTVCLNPDLASQVKVIRWDFKISESAGYYYRPGDDSTQQEWEQQWHMTYAYITLANNAAQSKPAISHFVTHLEPGPQYPGDRKALESLLMFTPNIEHLEIAENNMWDKDTLWLLPIICRLTDFSRLTSVTMDGSIGAHMVELLMILPTMRRLKFNRVYETQRDSGRTPHRVPRGSSCCVPKNEGPPGSQLEHLHMLQSFTSLNYITELVSVVPNLKTFVYEQGLPLSSESLSFPYRNVARILKHHRLTLTSLRIAEPYATLPFFATLSADQMADQMLWDERYLFDVIGDLPNLINLEVFVSGTRSRPYQSIRWETLPPRLEHLTIDYTSAHEYQHLDKCVDTSELDSGLADLQLRKRRGELPHLRTLAFKNWHPFYGTFPRDMSVKKELKDAGIHFNSLPAEIGSSWVTSEDIGWVELQTEPEWVIIEMYVKQGS